jgi:hypothetical protein
VERSLQPLDLRLPQGEIVGLFGKTARAKQPHEVHPGLLRCRGRSPWTASRSPAQYRPAVLRHQRALFFPTPHRCGTQEFYAFHFHGLPEKRFRG